MNHGPFARIFNDFGPAFLVRDVNGEETVEMPVASMQAEEGTSFLVTLVEGFKHKLADGDLVTLRGNSVKAIEG